MRGEVPVAPVGSPPDRFALEVVSTAHQAPGRRRIDATAQFERDADTHGCAFEVQRHGGVDMGDLAHCSSCQPQRHGCLGKGGVLPVVDHPGQVFEQATNESFLEFTKAGTGCPGEDEMSEQVEAAILRLQQVFADPAQ